MTSLDEIRKSVETCVVTDEDSTDFADAAEDRALLLQAIDKADEKLQRRAEQLWHAFDAEPDAENEAYAVSANLCLSLFRGAIYDTLKDGK